MLQAVSAGTGDHFIPFLENPHLVPADIIADAIVARLKQSDCVENGWILDGFPTRAKDSTFLKENGIHPNRFIDN